MRIFGELATSWCAALFFLAGCGGKVVFDGVPAPTCEQVCLKIADACPDKSGDCAAQCAPIDQINAKGICVAETQAIFSCFDQNPTASCMTNSVCTAEDDAFAQCIAMHCPGEDPSSCM